MSPRAFALALAAVLAVRATLAHADPAALFPSETASCHVGAESAVGAENTAAAARPARKGAAVTAVRLQRGHPQLALEEQEAPRTDGARLIYLRIIVTFADAGKQGGQKRYANGNWDKLTCSADACDGGNYRVERQADGAVLLRMTGGIYVEGDRERPNRGRRLPDGSVYRLAASPMAACH